MQILQDGSAGVGAPALPALCSALGWEVLVNPVPQHKAQLLQHLGTNQGWGWTGGTNTLQVTVPKGEGLHLAEEGWICRADGRGLCVIFSA